MFDIQCVCVHNKHEKNMFIAYYAQCTIPYSAGIVENTVPSVYSTMYKIMLYLSAG